MSHQGVTALKNIFLNTFPVNTFCSKTRFAVCAALCPVKFVMHPPMTSKALAELKICQTTLRINLPPNCLLQADLCCRVTATGPCVRNIKTALPPLDRAGAASLYVVLAIGISLGVLGLIALCIAGCLAYRWHKVKHCDVQCAPC